jgi:tRNA A-37 threonylcarbamoyl transferase component Bud32
MEPHDALTGGPEEAPLVGGTRLAHGFTNESWRRGDRIYKRYLGNDASERLRVEVDTIHMVTPTMPVPQIVEVNESELLVVFGLVDGRHGQELIDQGRGERVLGAAGRMLRRMHTEYPGLVHGDYGPQNLLLDNDGAEIIGVVDFEFAHNGVAIEDLAWAEWIVRTYHPAAIRYLDTLFDEYSQKPSWSDRQATMMTRCMELIEICTAWGDKSAADGWRRRAAVTRDWEE